MVLALIFVVQNSAAQTIRFLFWEKRVSLSLGLIAVGGVGLVIGFLWGALKTRAPK